MNYMAIPGEKWKGSFESVQTIKSFPERKERIIDAVLKHYGVTWNEVVARCRKRKFATPRQVIMYLLHDIIGMGCSDVGRLFNMDHTNAIHAFNLIQDLIDVDKEFANEIRGIKENIL